MLTHDSLIEIVNEINDLYGSTQYLPAEYMFADGIHFIKAFGEYIWDSDNCSATSISTIKGLAYREMNIRVLNPIWEQQTICMQEDLKYLLKGKVDEDTMDLVEEYFEHDLNMFKEKDFE